MRFRPKRNKGFETNGFTRTGGKKNHKDILEVEMKHGDMMVMAGCTIQKLYEVRSSFPDRNLCTYL